GQMRSSAFATTPTRSRAVLPRSWRTGRLSLWRRATPNQTPHRTGAASAFASGRSTTQQPRAGAAQPLAGRRDRLHRTQAKTMFGQGRRVDLDLITESGALLR